jgi:enhancing lycopene biosynthesis protein 2
MRFGSEMVKLSGKLEKLAKSGEEAALNALKEETLSVLKLLFGETSREYRVVLLTSSPMTIVKVLKHIMNRNEELRLETIEATA